MSEGNWATFARLDGEIEVLKHENARLHAIIAEAQGEAKKLISYYYIDDIKEDILYALAKAAQHDQETTK